MRFCRKEMRLRQKERGRRGWAVRGTRHPSRKCALGLGDSDSEAPNGNRWYMLGACMLRP